MSTRSLFPTTLWTQLLDPIRERTPQADQALNRLCQIYIPPLRYFVRSYGYDQHTSEDLVQTFIASLIRRQAIEKTSRDRGRFRSFLRTCLKNFLKNHYRSSTRGPNLLPLDESNATELSSPEKSCPDIEFDRRWAWSLLEQAIAEVENSYADRGKDDVFNDLKGFLPGGDPKLSRNDIAKEWGTAVNTVDKAAHDLRLRVRQAIRKAVSATVATSREVDDELRYMMDIMSR